MKVENTVSGGGGSSRRLVHHDTGSARALSYSCPQPSPLKKVTRVMETKVEGAHGRGGGLRQCLPTPPAWRNSLFFRYTCAVAFPLAVDGLASRSVDCFLCGWPHTVWVLTVPTPMNACCARDDTVLFRSCSSAHLLTGS